MMKVTILGSGSFISSLEHFGPSYLLESDNKKILIDAGQGTTVQLLKLGIKLEEIDYIFMTHFHADHATELIPILLWGKLAPRYGIERKSKLKVYGPIGSNKNINDLFYLYSDNPGDWYETEEIVDTIEIGKLKITSFKVIHKDLSAVAYRFEENGKIFVFSGDCTLCDGIKEAAKNADLLIVDASLPKEVTNDIHLNSTQVGQVCTESKVKKAVLSHLTPMVFEKDIVAEVKQIFNGQVSLAKDLEEIDI